MALPGKHGGVHVERLALCLRERLAAEGAVACALVVEEARAEVHHGVPGRLEIEKNTFYGTSAAATEVVAAAAVAAAEATGSSRCFSLNND